jgi:hypothetical protein
MPDCVLLYNSGVLPVLLQHPSICADGEQICLLMITSRVLRAAVVEHCQGRIDSRHFISHVSLAAEHASWLANHGGLLRSLSLMFDVQDPSRRSAAAVKVASGLQIAAAAAPAGLYLQAASIFDLDGDQAGLILQLMSASHLTNLMLLVRPDADEDHGDGVDTLATSTHCRALAAALAGAG